MLYATGSVFLLPCDHRNAIVTDSMTEGTRHHGELIDFGPKSLELVPFHAVNELPQVRRQYDEAAIAELAEAIMAGRDTDGLTSEAFELANPILAGRHTRDSARRYIDEHGDYFKIPTKEHMLD